MWPDCARSIEKGGNVRPGFSGINGAVGFKARDLPDLVGESLADAGNSARERGGGVAKGNLEERIDDADVGEAVPGDPPRKAGEEAEALRHGGARAAGEGERFK